ncbi:MAG: hypothetical protein MJ100_04720 [Ruminococcus sp.]|nr:hypothetical protein [Ruminococcus sp.]
MNEKDIDLTALENADDETLELMAEKYSALGNEKMDDLFARSLAEFHSRSNSDYRNIIQSSQSFRQQGTVPDNNADAAETPAVQNTEIINKHGTVFESRTTEYFEIGDENELVDFPGVKENGIRQNASLPTEKTDGVLTERTEHRCIRRIDEFFESDGDKNDLRQHQTKNNATTGENTVSPKKTDGNHASVNNNSPAAVNGRDIRKTSETAAESHNGIDRILENYVAELNSIKIVGTDDVLGKGREKSYENKNKKEKNDSVYSGSRNVRVKESSFEWLTNKTDPQKVDDEEKDNIFARSIQKYIDRIRDDNAQTETEFNIEIYKKSLWRKYASVAAGAVLLIGICGGTYMHIRNDPRRYDSESSSFDSNDNGYSKNEQKGILTVQDVIFDDVAFTSAVFSPHLFYASSSEILQIENLLTSSKWVDLGALVSREQGAVIYIYNGNEPIKIELFADNRLLLNNERMFRSDKDILSPIKEIIADASSDESRYMVWCDEEKLESGKIWGISGTPKMFEKPTFFDDVKKESNYIERSILDSGTITSDIRTISEETDDFVIGKIKDISYTEKPNGKYPVYTMLSVEMTYSRKSSFTYGETIKICLPGGFRSSKAKGGVLYYHEYALSGEEPIIGEKYGFFVNYDADGDCYAPYSEYGMLYYTGHYFYQRVGVEYKCWTQNEIFNLH